MHAARFLSLFRFQHPEKWSAEFRDLLDHLLAMNADERPTADQVLAHPFLRIAADRISLPKVPKKKKPAPEGGGAEDDD